MSNSSQSVPTLTNIIISFLISPRPPSNHPPLLDFDWRGAEENGETHPLLDARSLHLRIPSLPVEQLTRILQGLKSASRAATKTAVWSHRRLGVDQAPDPFPQSHHTSPPDDAARNPFFYPCPSPRHLEIGHPYSTRPLRHLFLDPAEVRLEWREFKGERDVPIRWLGCSPGCLAFLEGNDEGEEWWDIEEE